MTYYRRIDERVWGDAKFLSLTPILPSGRALWLYLLVGPQNEGLPGLFNVGRAAMAEELEWSLEAFQKAWDEIEAQGMAHADWQRRIVLLPKALRYNLPSNPNTVKSWADIWDSYPESDLKMQWLETLAEELEAKGRERWVEETAFQRTPGSKPDVGTLDGSANGSGNRSGNRSANGSGNGSGNRKGKGKGKGKRQGKKDSSSTPLPAESRDALREKEWKDWIGELASWAKAEKLPERFLRTYERELRQSIADFYESRGGRFTPTRMAYLAKRLQKQAPDVQLAAIEIFVDRCGGKFDERYLAGIATRMGRSSEAEMAADVKRHRKQYANRGIFASVFQTEEQR